MTVSTGGGTGLGIGVGTGGRTTGPEVHEPGFSSTDFNRFYLSVLCCSIVCDTVHCEL